MKLILAFVRPFVIDRLVVALEDIEDFPGVTVTDAEGFGQRIKTPDDLLRPLKASKRVEIAADAAAVDEIISVIRANAHTGKKGDGIILVSDVEQTHLV